MGKVKSLETSNGVQDRLPTLDAFIWQVFCVSNAFEQPADPVASQEEQETHTNLQENPSNGISYGSAD